MNEIGQSKDHFLNRWNGRVTVVSNDEIAAETWRIRVRAPEVAARVRPGQFLMLHLPGKTDPLLGRAFAIYDVNTEDGTLDVVYLVVGKMTRALAKTTAGGELELTGPLGNGWDVVDEEDYSRFGKSQYVTDQPPLHVVMVAGGIGQTPFYLFSKRHRLHPDRNAKLTLMVGARSSDRLCCLDEFEACGVETRVATEDGSRGTQGFVTDLLAQELNSTTVRPSQLRILGCGPKPMLNALWREASARELKCWVSLETNMGCGLGICYGCAVEYRAPDGSWDYRRTCIDGPVFDAWRLKWD